MVDQLAHSANAAQASEQIYAEIRDRLIAIGPEVVPYAIRHLREIVWYDEDGESIDAWETEAFLSALAQIDDERGRQFVIECGGRLMDSPDEPTYSESMLGCDAFLAMAASDDSRLHEVLADWVVAIDTSKRGWNLWWLIDPAVPFLDDRARSVLVELLDYWDRDSDVSDSARQALAAIDGR